MFKTLSLIAAFTGLLGWAGIVDYESALVMDAIEKEQRPLRAAQATLFLSLPIPYDATVTQSLPSGREAITRYYTRASK